ncbi:hypothetical protein [Microtetraspora malaysiensis]|uniref:Uncharacterized protein n=1 Tax=Microtetraspora malaysiensis TaxID=161358 RepID=A0ABW6T745_9ACTN
MILQIGGQVGDRIRPRDIQRIDAPIEIVLTSTSGAYADLSEGTLRGADLMHPPAQPAIDPIKNGLRDCADALLIQLRDHWVNLASLLVHQSRVTGDRERPMCRLSADPHGEGHVILTVDLVTFPDRVEVAVKRV